MKNIIPKTTTAVFLLLIFSAFSFCSCSASKDPATAMDYLNALAEADFPVENMIEKAADTEFLKYKERFVFADSRMTQFNPDYPIGGEIQVYETKEAMKEAFTNLEELYAEAPDFAMRLFSSPDELAILLLESDMPDNEAEKYKTAFDEFSNKRTIKTKFTQ